VSTTLVPVTLSAARTAVPNSSPAVPRPNASTMCLHSRIGSSSCSSRETQARTPHSLRDLSYWDSRIVLP
jgi:hypothetical protein